MPRISPRLLLKALRIDRALPSLIPVCKDIGQAQLELQWIRNELPRQKHRDAIIQRSRHVPLQYILGTQPFGDLEILCQRGVLIPRNDTEEWCFELIEALKEVNKNLHILDMCTGTGCIPLLLSSEIEKATYVGVDISNKAISLAKKNLNHNKTQLSNSKEVSFVLGDLFDKDVVKKLNTTGGFDLIVSNPPYIPSWEFNHAAGMEKSVRIYEPRLALEGDVEVFSSLIENVVLKSNCDGFVFELAGFRQINHVISLMKFEHGWTLGYRVDSNGQFRNVIGWKSNSSMKVLTKLCTTIL